MNANDPAALMRLAIEKSRSGIAEGNSPFGCAIAFEGRVVAVAHNVVLATTDITAHAEITALRMACRETNRIHLDDAIVATTCEPCPMCMAALHWARVGTVYYGATIADADAAGFHELSIPALEIVRLGGSEVKVLPNMLTQECKQLFAEWGARPTKQAY